LNFSYNFCFTDSISKRFSFWGSLPQELRSDNKHILNSPLNRTYISKTANREIGTHEPLHYLSFISDSARFGHCIPQPVDTVYTKNPKETEQDFYKRVLDRRFEELKNELNRELISLK
jgi:hypothetical protein